MWNHYEVTFIKFVIDDYIGSIFERMALSNIHYKFRLVKQL